MHPSVQSFSQPPTNGTLEQTSVLSILYTAHWSLWIKTPVHCQDSSRGYYFFHFTLFHPFIIHLQRYISHLYLIHHPSSQQPMPPLLCTFMATVSFTSTDLSCPFSSKKTSLWPALFRSPRARALMCRIFPLSSSTWGRERESRKKREVGHK